MASLAWYYARLRGMSAGEIAWRVRGAVRDRLDRYRFALGAFPSARAVLANGRAAEPPFRVCDIAVGAWAEQTNWREAPSARSPLPELKDRARSAHGSPPSPAYGRGNEGEGEGMGVSVQEEEDTARWCETLRTQADDIKANRLTFFDLEHLHLGDPIDWNRDHSAGRPAPMIYAQAIDYRDFNLTGDCKLVWEPNRHHQLVVLARAYRATGDVSYAAAVTAQLTSWLDQNPFGQGMNWRSPLELGVRLINWVWALDLIRESGLIKGRLEERLRHSIYLHCWEIARKYSRGSSANNHVVGEAAGVYIANAYFSDFPGAIRQRAVARKILLQEIEAQSYPDGCTREQALGYQYFVLQFYLLCGLVGRWIGDEFPRSYWSRLETMLEFVGRLGEGGPLPYFGDADDGYVLDLGGGRRDFGNLLGAGAIVFDRPDFAAWAGAYPEPARWLFGRGSRAHFDRLHAQAAPTLLSSHAFHDSGYYLLQYGDANANDRVSVVFDAGELGYGAIAAHGHADALSFVLRAFGEDILVDPGTYDYFTHPDWRRHFRSTAAHNTIVIDDADQSQMSGPFLWSKRAHAACARFEPTKVGGIVSGAHDGYAHLADPVIHRRTLRLDATTHSLAIDDELDASGRHDVALYFQVAEHARVDELAPGCYRITVAHGSVTLDIDPAFTVARLTGSVDPIGGWVSRGYHRKTPSVTLVARTNMQGTARYVCRAIFEPGR